MIHLSNKQIPQALSAASQLLIDAPDGPSVGIARLAATVVMNEMMVQFGLKPRKEPYGSFIDRIASIEEQPAHLFNADDRDTVGTMLVEMFEPFCPKHIIMLAIPDEGAPVIAPFWKVGEAVISMDQIRACLSRVINEEGNVLDL